ncbi:MAG TPA: hypothetical protein IAC90_00650 [Candidatus Coproplasma stercorigallinarum]|nr:hypothetical protein [Candidatus Coproplasma stercorigallinarum]
MKVKFDVTAIGAAVAAILSLVAIILFSSGYNGSQGYFEMQFAGLSYVVGFGVVTIILAAAAIVLPMINVEGMAKKAISIAVDVIIVAMCIFFCLMALYAAKSSVYEMALTWASELHINEPYMITACNNALASIILSIVAMIVVGVTACITKTIFAKKN